MLDLENILSKYRMRDTFDDCLVEGGMRLNRLFGLNDLIKENLKSDSIVCELGSHIGASSSLFSYYCEIVFCVDIWLNPIDEEEFNKFMMSVDNIIKIKGRSVVVSSRFVDKSLDLVYVDASHEYQDVVDDIMHWKPKIKEGGFLAGHDYNNSSTLSRDVIRAVNEQIGEPDKVYEDSSWIKKI